MTSPREARAEDFEIVRPLLLLFDNPRVLWEQWRQPFVNHSGCQDSRFGCMRLFRAR